MDLKWQMAMAMLRHKKFWRKYGPMKFEANKTKVGIDLEKVRCYNCNLYGHFSRDCKAPKDTSRYQQNKPPPADQIEAIEQSPPKALVVTSSDEDFDWSKYADEYNPAQAMIVIEETFS